MSKKELNDQRRRIAQSIVNSAARMIRFIELDAPPLIIENERVLMMKHVMNMPVETEFQLQAQKIRAEIESEESKFLVDHGYDDEILKFDSSNH
jgi:DNA-directed RNA polymerase beta' subunit